MYKIKKVAAYYCSICGMDFGICKPTTPCTHEYCGVCKYYDVKIGVCHINPYDDCADRDSHYTCNIDRFEAITKE